LKATSAAVYSILARTKGSGSSTFHAPTYERHLSHLSPRIPRLSDIFAPNMPVGSTSALLAGNRSNHFFLTSSLTHSFRIPHALNSSFFPTPHTLVVKHQHHHHLHHHPSIHASHSFITSCSYTTMACVTWTEKYLTQNGTPNYAPHTPHLASRDLLIASSSCH